MEIRSRNISDDGYNIRTHITDLNGIETEVLVRALEYYTDKRRLDFSERMKAGDMARLIKESERRAYKEASKVIDARTKQQKGQNNVRE